MIFNQVQKFANACRALLGLELTQKSPERIVKKNVKCSPELENNKQKPIINPLGEIVGNILECLHLGATPNELAIDPDGGDGALACALVEDVLQLRRAVSLLSLSTP